MKHLLLKQIIILGLLLTLVSCSACCATINTKALIPNNRENQIHKVQQILNLFNLQENPFQNQLGIYYTLSNSGQSKALHFHIPFLIRVIKSTGAFIMSLVFYNSADATTRVVDRNGYIVAEAQGKHGIFVCGLGMLGFNGSLINSPFWFASISIIPPRIITS